MIKTKVAFLKGGLLFS